MPKYQICRVTVLDSTYPGIKFDENGVCQFVHDFKQNVLPRWRTGPEGADELARIVENVRKEGKGRDFDCILGLSGGADSSYMLHVMVKKYGLRPLVFHVDGGWNSDLAVSNISGLVDRLGVDLYTEVIDWDEMRNFQLAMFKSGVPHLDTPQDMAFVGVLYKFAVKNGIKYILNGGNVSTECVPRPIDIVYWGGDMVQIRDILRRYGERPMPTYPFSSIFYHKLYLPVFKGIKVLKPLNFLPYVKKSAMQLMTQEYGWRAYPQKHFESRFTRFFEGYWLPTRFGFDMRRVDLSSLILTGQMTRDDAMAELENPPYDEVLMTQDRDYVAAKLGIDREELMRYQAMPKKYYFDYRNQRKALDFGALVLSKLTGSRRGGAM